MRSHASSSSRDEVRQAIQDPDQVTAMLALASQGWGTKKIAKQFGCSRNTVKRYLKLGGWQAYASPGRLKQLDYLEDWIHQAFRRHRGNADVVRQELKEVHGLVVSLRTVERAVEALRREIRVEAEATVRFETPPGHQLQIDFGQRLVPVGGHNIKVFFFVATLGFSRRIYAEAFHSEKQSSWFNGLENAFRYFGGTTEEVLVDNAGALVKSHNTKTREVVFTDRFLEFCKYWRIDPRACAPYRACTKGKDERGVRYVKSNAVAGREFDSMESLNSHLLWWSREVADVRVHGTTGELPCDRFEKIESSRLRPLCGRASFLQLREVSRLVARDSYVDLDTNRYSVPWKLVGEAVVVTAADGMVVIRHNNQLVASHQEHLGRFERITNESHLKGIFKRKHPEDPPVPRPDLLRSLEAYELAVGGGF